MRSPRRRPRTRRPPLARSAWRYFYRALLGLLALCVGLVFALRFFDPPSTAFMAHARWDAWRHGRDLDIDQRWIAFEQIPSAASLAVIAAEDQRFATHLGFDVTQIADALDDARRGKRMRGASTISQQTAKNLLLWPGQSWLRKGVEAGLTALIEVLWSKRRILEVYLNVAQFGVGTYGVEAAAQRYFRKGASRLDRHECALLAAVLPNPGLLRVDAPSAYVRDRQRWILDQMDRVAGLEGMEQLLR